MNFDRRTFLATLTTGLAGLVLRPALAQDEGLDATSFLPKDHYPALPGTLVMVVGAYRRDGAEEYLRFSADGSSWRDAFVPATDRDSLHKMEFPVGPEGEKVIYPLVISAGRTSTKDWAFPGQYALAEVEIHGGRGAPPGQNKVVITKARIVDGTADYPIRPAKVIDQLHSAHQAWMKGQQEQIELGLAKSRAAVDRKAVSRVIDSRFHSTWLSATKRLRFRVLTEIQDGSEGKSPNGPGLEWGIVLGQQVDVDASGKTQDMKVLPITIYQRERPVLPKEPERRFPGDPVQRDR